MNERIERLYCNLDSLTGHYVEFPETKASYKILNDYIEMQISFINVGINDEIKPQLHDLIMGYACDCEKQGFLTEEEIAEMLNFLSKEYPRLLGIAHGCVLWVTAV